MYDAASLSDAPVLQRAVGELRVSVRVRDGGTVLDGLRQAGCLKARFPRPVVPGWLDVVTLNTSGGIAGGDALVSSFQVGAGARATIAGQAAERFYRARVGSAAASVRTSVEVHAGGMAEWLPQETILFDRCALDRRLSVELAEDAWFVGVESLLFGRAAMGEVVRQGSLRDLIEVRRGGRLLLHDAVRMDGGVADLLGRAAVGGGACCVATLVHVGPGAERAVDAVRGAMMEAPSPGLLRAPTSPARGRGVLCGGVSGWDGLMVARILAGDGASLRMAVADVLGVLRGGRLLPRVWGC